MKFVVDECVGTRVAQWMHSHGYDVISIQEQFKGVADQDVLKIAALQKRILITTDKDFGDIVFRDKKYCYGVILLRLSQEQLAVKIAVLQHLLSQKIDFTGKFALITETSVRIIMIPNDNI